MIKRARTTYFISLAVATSAITLSYLLAGLSWVALLAPLTAVVWLWGDRHGRLWIGSGGLVIFVMMAAVGLMLSVSPLLAILAITAALAGWDIGRFNKFLGEVNRVEGVGAIESRYQKRLLMVAATGGIVAFLATAVRVNLGFAAALLLGLVSVLGFSRAIIFLRQERDG